MAKTIEELKESINNTINQNGTGQITGQGLNILLNEMADVLSTMGGNSGGDKPYRIYVGDVEAGELTTEEQSHNAEIFEKIYQKVETGEYVNVYANMNNNTNELSQSYTQINPLLLMTVDNSMIAMVGYLIAESIMLLIALILSSDGSVQFIPLKYESLE